MRGAKRRGNPFPAILNDTKIPVYRVPSNSTVGAGFHARPPEIVCNFRIPAGSIACGDVVLEKDVSVWYGAVLRGDAGAIRVGEGTNIQDLAVLHEGAIVSKGCTIGHSAIVHGCTVGDHCVIGMGAIVLNGAVLGDHCLVGAGAVVTGKMDAPAGSLILGNPAKVVKPLTQAQTDYIHEDAEIYVNRARTNLPEVNK